MVFSNGVPLWATAAALTLLCSIRLPACEAYFSFQNKIPNGANVPHPCKANYQWAGVGHENANGGGARNRFGSDFLSVGGGQWTRELCLMDSDGDGRSNGAELGDPLCEWREGEVPSRSILLSHPGVCDPYGSPQCQGQDSYVTCDLEEFSCPVLSQPQVRSFDIVFPTTKVPAKETNYFCMKQNIPESLQNSDNFVVALEALLDNLNVMHHIVVYGCMDEEAAGVPEGVYRCEGADRASCTRILGVWTVGLAGQCMPDNLGFRIGQTGVRTVLMEIHWNNPMMVDTYTDGSGIRLFYEPNRPGLIEAGVTSVANTDFVIPPGQQSVSVSGVCRADCSHRWITQPIQVYDLLHHMHYLGRSQVTTVTRDGVKKTIVRDNKYSYDSPVVHRLNNTFELRPGDEVETVCEYSSLARKTTTYAGQGTQDEMCVTLLFFYPMDALNAVSCGNVGDLDYCIADYPGEPETNGCQIAEISWFKSGKGLENLEKLRTNCKSFEQCTPECDQVVKEILSGPCFKNGVFERFHRLMPADPNRYELISRMSACRRQQQDKTCTFDDVMRDGLDLGDLLGEDVRDGGLSVVANSVMAVCLACFSAAAYFVF